jgi:hypothetical protein
MINILMLNVVEHNHDTFTFTLKMNNGFIYGKTLEEVRDKLKTLFGDV